MVGLVTPVMVTVTAPAGTAAHGVMVTLGDVPVTVDTALGPPVEVRV